MQLPSTLTEVRAMSISASAPRIRATPSIGKSKGGERSGQNHQRARGTAATPLLVSISVSIISSCWPSVM